MVFLPTNNEYTNDDWPDVRWVATPPTPASASPPRARRHSVRSTFSARVSRSAGNYPEISC